VKGSVIGESLFQSHIKIDGWARDLYEIFIELRKCVSLQIVLIMGERENYSF